jgi:predicted transcriptional regulator
MAVRVSRIEEQEPPKPKPKPAMTIDDRAYSTIKISDGYLTTAEMAELLNTDSTIAHNALLRLFNQGKIAKADVYGSGGQSRPSFCLWAVSAKTFVGEEE